TQGPRSRPSPIVLSLHYRPHLASTPHSAFRTPPPHSELRTPHSALPTPSSALRTSHPLRQIVAPGGDDPVGDSPPRRDGLDRRDRSEAASRSHPNFGLSRGFGRDCASSSLYSAHGITSEDSRHIDLSRYAGRACIFNQSQRPEQSAFYSVHIHHHLSDQGQDLLFVASLVAVG